MYILYVPFGYLLVKFGLVNHIYLVHNIYLVNSRELLVIPAED